MKSNQSVLFLVLLLALGTRVSAVWADEAVSEKGKKDIVGASTTIVPSEPQLDKFGVTAATEETGEVIPIPADEPAPIGEDVLPAAETAVAEAVKAAEEKVDQAAPAEGEKKESLLEKYPPQVKLSQWGPEIRINVIPDPQMGTEGVLAVQSVKLETEKGEYLGLKTFQPEEKARDAEFMINPDILKIEAVKLTVSSKTDGQWTHIQPLKDEEGGGPEAGKPEAPKPAEKPKKKGWLW